MMISPLGAQDEAWALITFENFDEIQPLVTIPQDAEWGRTFFISDRLLAITSGEEIHLWDVVRKERIHVLGLDVGVISKDTTALAGSHLVIGASIMDTGRIRIWDLEMERWLGPVIDVGGFSALAVSPNRDYMAIGYYGSDGPTIELRDYPSGEFIRIVATGTASFPADTLVFLDDTHLAGAETDSGAMIYDLETGEQVFLYHEHEENILDSPAVDSATVSASGRYVAWRRGEAYAEIWDWREEHQLPIDGTENEAGGLSAYWTMAFSPDEQLLVSFYKNEYRESRPQHSYLTAWNLKTYERVKTEFGVEHNDMAVISDIFDIAFNPDGRSIAVLYQDKIELWGVPAEP